MPNNDRQSKKKNFILAYFQGLSQYTSGHPDQATMEALYLKANPNNIVDFNNRRRRLESDAEGS